MPLTPLDLIEFVIQCSCDWERKVSDPDCRACDAMPECVTCEDGASYDSELGPVCLRCFTQPGPSLADLALMKQIDAALVPTPLEQIPETLRRLLLG